MGSEEKIEGAADVVFGADVVMAGSCSRGERERG